MNMKLFKYMYQNDHLKSDCSFFNYLHVYIWLGGGGVTAYVCHVCAARIAPFYSAARYTISPFFLIKKFMTDPVFHHCYMNGPIF